MDTNTATVIIDCGGVKMDAFKCLFRSRFKYVFIEKVETIFSATPYSSFDSLFTTCVRRLGILIDEFPRAEPVWYATIQKGFYKMDGTYYLSGAAGIRKPNGILLYNPLGSVPLPERVSEAMCIDPKKSYDALKVIFPNFNKKTDSYYEFVTKEREKDWLLAGLRPLLRTLIEFY